MPAKREVNRQRYLAQPDDETIILERRQICAILRGFANGSQSERAAYARGYKAADDALELALSDRETVRRHDKDPDAMPWFQHGSLHYFEIVLASVTGTQMR